MRRSLLTLTLLLAACKGGSDAPKDVSFGGTVSGLPGGQHLTLAAVGQALEVSGNGAFSFPVLLAAGDRYEVEVAQQPAGAHCVVDRAIGAARAGAVSDVAVRCSTDESAAFLDPAQVHHLRLTVSADEWSAFVLQTGRSGYLTDARGWPAWNLWTVSEVYRRGTLEVLDDQGQVTATLPDVGFRMRGSTSRMWPEYWYDQGDGSWTAIPRRFHLNLKFDETFDGDESVYACIDANGQPTASWAGNCSGLIADDVPEVAANKDRTFMGLEAVALKYNKDDPTYVREALAYTVLRDSGVPAARAVHTTLELVVTATARNPWLNNRALPQTTQMGVFTLVEPVDKPFLVRSFGRNGYMFKVSGGDLSWLDPEGCVPYESRGAVFVDPDFCTVGVEQSDPDTRADWVGAEHAADPDYVNSAINQDGGPTSQFAPYRPSYDLKTRKSGVVEARAALRAFIAKVADPATPLSQIEAALDVDGFIRAQAVDVAIGGVDHYARVANNYYLYLNPDTGKWTYIPYDYDFTFRDTHIASWPDTLPFRDVVSTTIFAGTTERWRDVRVPETMNPVLYDRIFESAAHRQELLDQVSAIRGEWLDWSHRTGPVVEAWVTRLEPAIAATTAASPDSGDTDYRRAAALGDRYTYGSWVSAQNSLAEQLGGPYPGDAFAEAIESNDTLKRFVQRRSSALAGEAP
ncbi:MAG: CotH kinase family protein [Anaeromyxobacter sp.]